MDPEVVAALIAGAAVIIAATINTFSRAPFALGSLQRIPPERKDALRGSWIGVFRQEAPKEVFGDGLDVEVTFSFEPRWKTIRGRAEYKSPIRNEYDRVVVKGAFYNDRFLRLEYENELKHVVHFGLFLLELSGGARRLEGRFLGIGRDTQVPVRGTVTLRKQQ